MFWGFRGGGLPEPKPEMLAFSGSRSNVNLTALARSSSYLRSLTKCWGGGGGVTFNYHARRHICKENRKDLFQSPWYLREAHSAARQTWRPIGLSAAWAPRLSSAESPKSTLKQKTYPTFNSGHQLLKARKAQHILFDAGHHTKPLVLYRTCSKQSEICQDIL